MKRLLPFVAGALLGIVGLLLAVYVYFAAGIAPAATAAPDMPFEKMLARKALHARIDHEMPSEKPPDVTEVRLMDGADVYRAQCAVCHGTPGGKKTAIAAGMYPRPPQLFEHGVDDDPAGETWWKIANGIRLTGMPAYRDTLTADQVWDVTLLLTLDAKALPKSVWDDLHRTEN